MVVGADEDRVRAALDNMHGVTICRNPEWVTGLSSSLRVGLGCIEGFPDVDGVLVSLADQPYVSSDFLSQLITAFRADERLVAAAYNGVIGVPALFGKEFFGELAGLSGDAGAGLWLRARAKDARSIPMPAASFDVDTPADITKLKGKPPAEEE